MEALSQDLKYGARMLAKNPGFTAVAVLTLALGIGANTTVFSFINALLLRPFPFRDLDRLVTVWERPPGQEGHSSTSSGEVHRNPVTPADCLDFQRYSNAFERFSFYRPRDFNLGGVEEPERLQGVLVSPEFFPVLGAKAALGRTFLPEEYQPGRDQVVLLSHGFWQRRFGSDAAVLDKDFLLNNRRFTAVGVMPSDFEYPLGGVELWVPLALTEEERTQRGTFSLYVLARLKPDVSLSQAQSEMDTIAGRLEQQYPNTNLGRGVTLLCLTEIQRGLTAAFLLVFEGAAAFVLLIACANLANLLLAQATGRNKEMALRVALGASRWRIVRQLLTESLCLSLLGGALAVWFASVGLDLIRTSLPQDITKHMIGWKAIQMDGRALGFALVVAFLTSILLGLAPALQAAKTDFTSPLQEGSRSSATGPGRGRLRRILVVSEVTLALVLLVGAGLTVQGFLRLGDPYQGIHPENVMTMRIILPLWKYTEPRLAGDFYEQLLENLQTLPGVESVGVATQVPADMGPIPRGTFSIEGRPALTPSELPTADFQTISPDYFRVLRISLVAGRAFRRVDGPEAPSVAIISQSMAQRFWPGEDPVGKRVKVGPPESSNPWLSIVGVASDVKQYWFDRQPRPTLYLHYRQGPRHRMKLLTRTTGDPEDVVAATRAEIRNIDKDQPVDEIRTMEQVVLESSAFMRLAAGLMLTLGVVALALAAVGVYAVMFYYVAQRTHEIGIRMALGAQPSEILHLVLGQALKLMVGGLVIGLPAALALGRLLSSLLFGVVRSDVFILTGITLGLAAVVLLAGYIPAQRATRVDPTLALRYE
jgi:putative ABC transport system permease protein